MASPEKATIPLPPLTGGDRLARASDIDVLVVYAGPPLPEAYATVKKTFGLRGLEPHVYTETEAEAKKETLERMTQDGVIVYETRGA